MDQACLEEIGVKDQIRLVKIESNSHSGSRNSVTGSQASWQPFSDELGLVKSAPAKIYVDPAAQPRFHKPWIVLYALKGKIDWARTGEAGLRKLASLNQYNFADWVGSHCSCGKEKWEDPYLRGIQGYC